MANTERLYRIESMIRLRGHVSFRELLDALEVSPATLKRDLEYLRSRLGAPVEYDASVNGYRLGDGGRVAKQELPGLWFSERELYSLLSSYQLLNEVDREGVINRHLAPLLERVRHMLGKGDPERAGALMQRVRIVSALRRPVPSEYFERVGEALMRRRRLALRYLTRGRQQVSERTVSPQRLVHYRSTWYLDAWCHRVDGWRRFALDAVEWAQVLVEEAALELPLEQVEAAMDAGYGIYAGGVQQWATLQFSSRASAWVSKEEWHPMQRGRWLENGEYELRVPYLDDTELVMDILRQADEVRVIEPSELREKVLEKHRAAMVANGC